MQDADYVADPCRYALAAVTAAAASPAMKPTDGKVASGRAELAELTGQNQTSGSAYQRLDV